jgi:cobalt-zinc-cadmium efflux system outer membrane protein
MMKRPILKRVMLKAVMLKRAMLLVMLAGPSLLPAQTAHVFRGKVVSVSAENRNLTVENEPIEGWMGSMTMAFPVENSEILATIHPGDQITATVYDGDFTLHKVALVTSAQASSAGGVTIRLEQLEAMALARNPTLRQAESMRQAAEGVARQAGLYPNPTVGYYGDEIRGGYSGGGKQGGFVSQTIVLGGKLGAARRLAAAETGEAAASVDLWRARVIYSVRVSFYKVLAAQRLVEVRDRQSALASDTVVTSRQLANTGQVDRAEILQAELELHQAELGAVTARQNLRMAWRLLAADAGNPELPQTLLEGDLDGLPGLQFDEVVARASQESPEVTLAQRTLDRAGAMLDSAKKAPIPDLALSGTLAHNFEPIEGTARETGLQGGAQIGVQIPVFNRNQGNIAAGRAGIESARAALDREKLRIRRLLSSLFFEYEMARDTAFRYRTEILPSAAEVLAMYQSNYQGMAGPYPPVLLAQRTLFQLQVDALRALEAGWQSALALQNYGIASEER